MDLRTLSDGLTPEQRCETRRTRVEAETGADLSLVAALPNRVGDSDARNCEQMIGHVPLPVGVAGPLGIRFSSEDEAEAYLPLATTEGALVASVNRGCKAVSVAGARTDTTYHGITRSIAWKVGDGATDFAGKLKKYEREWTLKAEGTSGHLRLLGYDVDESDGHVFLTLRADTDEAMGMNMVTIAAEAVGRWATRVLGGDFVTVAANVDSDKKPSLRTYEKGRGYEVTAETTLSAETIAQVLKTDAEAMLRVFHAKLEIGSEIAGAIGRNLHVANVVAALYLATGQDAAHVVEGSLSDTWVASDRDGLKVTVRMPAVIVGVRGGGTGLPAQKQCRNLLLSPKTTLHPCVQLAETIGAAALAGEISLLAAQAAQDLAKAHAKLGR